jgi:small-conductance mechanosensitive channel
VEFDALPAPWSRGAAQHQDTGIDQSILSVPNSKLAASIVSNGALRISRRVAFHIRLVYATPPLCRRVCKGVKTLLSEDPEIEPDSVLVSFEKFAASSRCVYCLPHPSGLRGNAAGAEKINLAILNMAREMDVSMAFPSISLYQERPSKAMKEAGYEAD